MDIYSTSFTHPRRTRHIHSEFPNTIPPDPALPEDVDKLAIHAMSIHNVHISYLPPDHTHRGCNFYISGPYQQVMAARGMLLKDCPIQVRLSLSPLYLQLSQYHLPHSIAQQSKLHALIS
jgi:hypothetical protein